MVSSINTGILVDISSFPANKFITYPFCDHSYYFRSKEDSEGKRIIYFVSQPYLDNDECHTAWQDFLTEEAKIVQMVVKYKKNYVAPKLDYIVLGKEKSFYYPDNTNLVIIGLTTDIQNIKEN